MILAYLKRIGTWFDFTPRIKFSIDDFNTSQCIFDTDLALLQPLNNNLDDQDRVSLCILTRTQCCVELFSIYDL